LKEGLKAQQAIAEAEIQIAQQRLAIVRKEADSTTDSREQQRKLAEAQVAYDEVFIRNANQKKELQEQINGLSRQDRQIKNELAQGEVELNE